MFHKQNAMIRAGFVVLGLAVGAVFGSSAQAQQFKMNIGCPTLGSEDLGKYTIDQLNEACHNSSSGSSSSSSSQPVQVASAEGGAALSCGQHKALAAFARMNPGFVEGETSQAIVSKYCGDGVPDNSVPQGSQAGGDLLSGVFRFERGYHTQYSGAKRRICQPYYSGDAYLERGKITFTSGGHTWRGTISQNSFVSITRDGVTPRPKNPTSISGPMLEAELYNGYCGYGFFRLSAK